MTTLPLKLFYAPGACSLAPHILLRETGLPFTLVRVDLTSGSVATGGHLRSINPAGLVPVLELDDGSRLTEGPVICQYLADRAGAADLMPAAGTLDRYRVMAWQHYISSELHKSYSPLFARKVDAAAREALAAEGMTATNAGQAEAGGGAMNAHLEAFAAVTDVLQRYLDGLPLSDTDRLRAVFHPKAVYASAAGDVPLVLHRDEYLPIVDRRPSPASKGEARADRIVAIDFIGPVTAVARLECAILPRHFDDVLTLILVDGRWQIVSKVFHIRPALTAQR